jgi:hypothetical protein
MVHRRKNRASARNMGVIEIESLPVYPKKLTVSDFYKKRINRFSWIFSLTLSIVYIILALFYTLYFNKTDVISAFSVAVVSSSLAFSFFLWRVSK